MTTRSPQKAQECQAKAVECEIRAANTQDQELKDYYICMAKDWRYLARQIETVEAELAEFAAKKSKSNDTGT